MQESRIQYLTIIITEFCVLDQLNLNYKDPNEKKRYFRKKSLGSAGSDR